MFSARKISRSPKVEHHQHPPRRKILQKWPMKLMPFRVLGPFWRFCIVLGKPDFQILVQGSEVMEPILQVQT